MKSKQTHTSYKTYICLSAVLLQIFSPTLSARAQVAGATDLSSGTSSSTGSNTHKLDLSSQDKTMAASSLLSGSSQPVTINLGGTSVTVQRSDMLTGAEYLAVQQVLSGGMQAIQLNSLGAAIGGRVDISSLSTNSFSSLVVPTGVSALYNFGQSSSLNLSGNLVNSGNFYAYSTNSAVSTAVINAANIFNNQNSLISSILPSSFNIANAIPGLSLSLNAVQNIVNAGSIMSAANLSATAGGSIINALPSGVSGISPIMQAMQNINLQASSILNQGTIASQLANANLATANLTNSGLLQALSGSVNIQNLIGQTLNVDGVMGIIRARDSVLFQSLGSSYSADGSLLSKAGIDIVGQSITASVVNINSPDGVINVNADAINGKVDLSGGIAYVGAKHGDLTISKMALSGDPIYYASGGNLDLSGLFSGSSFSTSGGDFIALSSNDIIAAAAPGSSIDATSLSTQGGKIGLYAGVTFTVSGGFSPISCSNCTPNYSISGLSGNGGNIAMGSVSLLTNSNTITLQANSGTTSNGTISIGNINSSATTAGQNAGIVNISAPSDISTGSISANGSGTGAGGYVNITSSAGSVTSTALSSTGGSGGLVNVSAATSITMQALNSSASGSGNAGDIYLRAGSGAVSVSGLINSSASGLANRAGEVGISSTNDISIGQAQLSGSSSAAGGSLSIAGKNLSISGSIDTGASGGGSNSAGNVSLFAENDISSSSISASSQSGNGGLITLAAGNSGAGNINVGALSASSGGGASSSGGSIISSTPGLTTLGAIDTSNGGSGQGGSLTVVSGTSGTARAAAQSGILSIGAINTAGSSRGGDIVVSNLGSGGAINTGNITSAAAGLDARGGSVGMVANGTVTVGTIDAQATAAGSSGARAGDLFLSSGAAGGTGISTGNINLNAASGGAGNRAGNSFFVVNSAVGVSTGTLTQTGGTAGLNFSGTPTTPQATITVPTTITVTPGSVVNFNPGGFNSAASGSLTVNTGGDERLLVPLNIRGGNVSLSGLTGAVSGGQPSSTLLLAAGNISISGTASSTSATQAGGTISIVSSAGTVTTQTANASGTAGGSINIVGSQGYSLANTFSLLANGSSAAGGRVVLLTPGQVAGNMLALGTAANTSNNGIQANGISGGQIFVASRGNLQAFEFDLSANGSSGNGGNINLRSLAGTIDLRQGSVCCPAYYNGDLTATSTSGLGGNIFINAAQNFSTLQDTFLNNNNYSTSVIRADGASGGRVNISTGGNIDIQRSERIDARGTAGAGGRVDLSSIGNSTTREVSVTGTSSGGLISINSGSYNLTSGFGLVATGTAGTGGRIDINTAGITQFASSGNNSNRDVDASGSTGGGFINVRAEGSINIYETELMVNTTNGGAGTISLNTNSGSVLLYQASICCPAYYNSSLLASSTNGSGGTINVNAFGDFQSIQDTGLNNNNY
ncbi:MAG: hypothetical protein K2X27_05160, partial [Candidatus Obscuribacterales bacterium]|nr:hypothetical protein [Candidatus Obscuribacterales bacterium]